MAGHTHYTYTLTYKNGRRDDENIQGNVAACGKSQYRIFKDEEKCVCIKHSENIKKKRVQIGQETMV